MQIDSRSIEAMLAERQWSKSTLADRSGISRQSISVILVRGSCSTINAGRIAKALGVPVSKLLKEV